MTKKITPESLAALPVMVDEITKQDPASRIEALNLALQHHKINGGMLTVDQLLANTVKFHAYITGEDK